MKTKAFIYMTGLLAMLSACSNDDTTKTTADQQAGRSPIILSYQTVPIVETRAVASPTLNNDNIVSGKSVVVRISETGANQWTDYIYTTGTGGTLTPPSPAPTWPLDKSNLDFLAYFPAGAVTNGTFTVQTDQTTNDNYVASDLLWATPVINQAKTNNVELAFSHKMAKIVVNATPGTGLAKVNSITLKNIKPSVSFNVTDGTVGEATGTATDIAVATGEDATSVTGVAVIPAQTITGALLEITVTDEYGETGTAAYSVDSKAFAAGHVYTINMAVNLPQVGVTTAITGWSESGNVTINPMVNTSPNTFFVNGVTFKMIPVKGGEYNTYIGITEYEGTPLTGTLTDFAIGETEVTQALWKAVMGTTPDGVVYRGLNPVINITWESVCDGSDSFLEKLNAATASQRGSKQFKLPTNAQWEWAARGGLRKDDFSYAGSNDIDEVCWYSGNCSTHQEVGQKSPNVLGLYDMSGNAKEMCRDYYRTSVTKADLGSDYCVIKATSGHAVRGGAYNLGSEYCNVTSIVNLKLNEKSVSTGFRLVLQ